MKKTIALAATILISVAANVQAQAPVNLSEKDQKEIRSILGADGAAIFQDGAVIITKPTKVAQIKVDPKSKTGFANFNAPGSAAEWVAVKKEWWVAKSAGKELEQRLGKERFAQLKSVLDRNNIR